MAREEFELPLSKEAFEHMKPKTDGIFIEKTRYLIPYDDKLTIELDVFHGKLAPLVLAEVEFRTWLGELKSRCDIVTVISRYCNVVPKGRSYWTCCPFHIEKTPSLCIYDVEQTFHCYGCKEHGDVIRFVMKIESCDFMQAVEILAKSVGMEVPNFSIKNSDGIEKRKKSRGRRMIRPRL